MRLFVSMLVLFAAFTSCTVKMYHYSLVSTKEIDLQKFPSLQKAKDTIQGNDKRGIIILIPTKKIRVSNAIDNAINSIPGCVALTDVKVYYKVWYIPYVYGREKFVVEGRALIDPSVVVTETSNFGKVLLDEHGNVKSYISISDAEYEYEKNKVIGDR